MTERLDAFQRRHRWAGFPLAVVYKYFDDQGHYLAALITFYAFLSIVPLLLLGSSVLGILLQGNPDLRDWILDSALSQFPVIGDQLGRPEGLPGSGAGVLVGALGLVYGALGIAQATQNAMNVAWAVPRNRRPNPFLSRLRSMVLLITAGFAILGTTLLSALGSRVDVFGVDLGGWPKLLVTLATITLNAAIFVVLLRMATAHRQSLRAAAPGAVLAAVVWHLLQLSGAAFVDGVVREASITNSVFALVLGLVAWIYLGAVTVVIAAEVNVVHDQRLYPRALLTPFTDNVDLTPADRRAYAGYANAQRTKGFQSVDVRFANKGQNRDKS